MNGPIDVLLAVSLMVLSAQRQGEAQTKMHGQGGSGTGVQRRSHAEAKLCNDRGV